MKQNLLQKNILDNLKQIHLHMIMVISHIMKTNRPKVILMATQKQVMVNMTIRSSMGMTNKQIQISHNQNLIILNTMELNTMTINIKLKILVRVIINSMLMTSNINNMTTNSKLIKNRLMEAINKSRMNHLL